MARHKRLCPSVITPTHVAFVDLKHKGKIIEMVRYNSREELKQIIRERINNIKCGKVINITPEPVRENSQEAAPIQIDNFVNTEASSLFDNNNVQFSDINTSFDNDGAQALSSITSFDDDDTLFSDLMTSFDNDDAQYHDSGFEEFFWFISK